MTNDDIFAREKLLMSENQFRKIKNACIAVIGVGGVGGYVCEMLVRAGVGTLIVCDFDRVDVSNINRQIIALTSNVGKFKVDEIELRLKLINPNLNLIKLNAKMDEDLINEVDLKKCDYIVDAIDDIHNKLKLIEFAYLNDISIVSSMGAGNKLCIPHYEVCDIYKTQYDKFAKIIRQKCKEKGIKHLDVVYMKTDKIIKNNSNKIGSISYHPCACGAVLASFVINKLIDSNWFIWLLSDMKNIKI